jgi:hypothetical protein
LISSLPEVDLLPGPCSVHSAKPRRAVAGAAAGAAAASGARPAREGAAAPGRAAAALGPAYTLQARVLLSGCATRTKAQTRTPHPRALCIITA